MFNDPIGSLFTIHFNKNGSIPILRNRNTYYPTYFISVNLFITSYIYINFTIPFIFIRIIIVCFFRKNFNSFVNGCSRRIMNCGCLINSRFHITAYFYPSITSTVNSGRICVAIERQVNYSAVIKFSYIKFKKDSLAFINILHIHIYRC